MARNRRRFSLAATGEARASLGDAHVDTAITELNRIQQKAVTLMTSYNCTREKTLEMLFSDDDLDKLKQVRGMVRPSSETQTYRVVDDVSLTISFKDALVPTIEPGRLQINHDRVGPLLTFLDEARAVHNKYEEVKAVLRWLNRNATPGAIRYYWPTAMKLVKESPIWRDLQEVPSRFSQPPKLGEWLQSFKDTATTMAGAAMLPSDAQRRQQNLMWIQFQAVQIDGGRYLTDYITYNL